MDIIKRNMSTKKLSIIIPAYKEEENLSIILPKIISTVNELSVGCEILVIDTQSKMDATEDVCAIHKVRYINRTGGNYYGDAVRTGIAHAEGEHVIFMDADGSHTPEFIQKLYAERDGYDVVVASRYIKGGETDNSKALVYMSLVLNNIYSVVLGLDCKDVSNSFKQYRKSDIKNLHLTCNNFDIVEELLFKLKRSKKTLSIKEVPFAFKKRMFGETKRNLVVFIATFFLTLVKLRFSK
jgi:dolichol-phosphate mannosyltransferase